MRIFILIRLMIMLLVMIFAGIVTCMLGHVLIISFGNVKSLHHFVNSHAHRARSWQEWGGTREDQISLSCASSVKFVLLLLRKENEE